jgi:hypothetical protein
MKKCPYCGAENPDDAAVCAIDQTPLENPGEVSPKTRESEYTFPPLAEADKQKDLVTLVTCRTLVAADIVVSRLRASGIQTFLPDERLMQWVGWNFNTYGYVRVQISPRDYDAAKDLLSGLDDGAN